MCCINILGQTIPLKRFNQYGIGIKQGLESNCHYVSFIYFSYNKPHINVVTLWFTFLLYGVIYFSILGFYCMTSIPVRVSTWEGTYTWGWPTWCTTWMSASPGSSYSHHGSGCGTGSHATSIRTDWNGPSSLTWTASVNTCPWLNWGTISKVSHISGTVSKVSHNSGTVSKVSHYSVTVSKVGLCPNWRTVYLRWVNRL